MLLKVTSTFTSHLDIASICWACRCVRNKPTAHSCSELVLCEKDKKSLMRSHHPSAQVHYVRGPQILQQKGELEGFAVFRVRRDTWSSSPEITSSSIRIDKVLRKMSGLWSPPPAKKKKKKKSQNSQGEEVKTTDSKLRPTESSDLGVARNLCLSVFPSY